jgi:hypothetical protein
MIVQSDPDPTMRKMLLALVLIGIVGLIAELLLLGHTDSATQWIPLVSLGAGLATTLAVRFAPGRATLRAFQFVMLVFVIAGGVGVYLHFAGNIEWIHERTPELGGWPLVWKALRGATPALAPGALAQLGLLGLVYAWRYPGSTAGNSK